MKTQFSTLQINQTHCKQLNVKMTARGENIKINLRLWILFADTIENDRMKSLKFYQ